MQFRNSSRLFRRYLIPFGCRQAKQQHSKARMLLLPEIPTDTAETNGFIRCIENKELPKFDAWSVKDSVNGVAKFGLEYEGWLLAYFENLPKSTKDKILSFPSLMDPLENQGVFVNAAWYTFFQLYAVLNFDNQNVENRLNGLQKLVGRMSHTLFSAPEFYQALKELVASKSVSDPWEARLLENFLLEYRLNGLELTPHKMRQLNEIRSGIEDKKTNYRENIMNSQVKLKNRTVDDYSELLDAPEHIIRYLSDNPDEPIRLPFTIRHTSRKYATYLQYCRRRLIRWTYWHTMNNRSAFSESTILFNNSSIVEDMRHIREREAKWLGFKTYADCQLSVCMANSVDEVKGFLTSFGEKASDKLDTVYEDMCNLADVEGENSKKEPPDAWDLPYYARRVANEKFRLNHHDFAEYFPYPQTMKNILGHVGRLFGIQFRDASKTVPRWHPTVEVYEIRKEAGGDFIAHFYIDPYMRKNKPLMSCALPGRPKSNIAEQTPIAYLNLALTPPTSNKPSLIYFDQLSSLACELGRALQHVLSSAAYSVMSGDRLVEWDCKEVCARVMELLVTGRHGTLVDISQHYQNGQKIGVDMAKSHVKGYAMTNLPSIVRDVLDSELDITLYSTRAFWRDEYRNLHVKYLPYQWSKKKGDEFICNFGGYVTDNTASKYFSTLWSKKLASDIVETFEEAKGDEDVATVGKRYADVYLFNGGKYSQAEMFKKFRGRDPIVEPMVKFYVSP